MKKILIVDDEMDLCFLLSQLLQAKQYTTQFANTLAEAKTAFQEFNPSLIFLDIHLPDGSGLHFMDFVQAIAPTPIIILMTAYDETSQPKEALARGADYFMAKPFTHADIDKVLHQFLPES